MQDLTQGSVTRHLLTTASFMLVTMVFQTLYFLVDLYWVGHLGKEAVAAVAIAGNLAFLVLAITQMLAVGTTTLIAHAAGARDRARAQLVFNQSLVLGAAMGALFLAAGLALRTAYSRAMSADAPTAVLAGDYLLWFIPAMALQFGVVAMSAALRGTGDFRPGMIVQSWTVILNIVLAPLLMFGWVTPRPLGVAGAAIASLLSLIVGTAWLATWFRGPERFLSFSRSLWTPQPALWGAMLKVGLPAGAEFALTAVYLFLVYSIARRFGSAAQAGFGIGMRIIQSGFMPVVALGFAVAPVAGQNFGARRADRVKQAFGTAVLIAAGMMLVFTALCHLAPARFVRVFSTDGEVVAVGGEYLRILSWTFVASGVVFVSSSMFQAMGNTVPALVSSFTRLVLVAVPLLLLSRTPAFALDWIWYLSAAAIGFQMFLSLALLRREFRVRMGAWSLKTADAPAISGGSGHSR